MMIGSGFSCCDQKSIVKVNDSTLTTNPGCGDGQVASRVLITVGSFDGSLSLITTDYADDRAL